MADLNEQFEKLLLRIIARANRKIVKYHESAINTLSLQVSNVKFKGQVFSLADYPQLRSKMDAVLKQLNTNIYSVTVNSIKESWGLSNKKNDRLVDRRYASKNPTVRMKQVLYDPNRGALDRFTARRVNGINLSDRVWANTQRFKTELEAGLGNGISNGLPAREVAKDLRKHLWEPERLFRRVRDSNGKLKLSKPAQAFNPGQGTYRSSVKNAQRVTRTETNMAFRAADHERWKNMPFVIGIEVKLSNNHPKYDICDVCAGRYPKDYKFTGWHPHCRCYAIPVMMSDEDYDRLQDSMLGLADFDPSSVQHVTEPPPGFTRYIQENSQRIAGWKNTPYWVTENKKFYNAAKKAA